MRGKNERFEKSKNMRCSYSHPKKKCVKSGYMDHTHAVYTDTAAT